MNKFRENTAQLRAAALLPESDPSKAGRQAELWKERATLAAALGLIPEPLGATDHVAPPAPPPN